MMKLRRYLKDHAVFIGACLCIDLSLTLVLYVFGLNASQIGFACVLVSLACFAALLFDHIHRRRFYNDLDERLAGFNRRYFLAELLDRPGFLEGELFYDALAAATKDMNDEIARYRIAAEEYQEYIETWIHEIKTPIAASRLILENSAGDEMREDFSPQLDRVEAFIEQALYFSRSAGVEKDYAIRAVLLENAVKSAVRKQSRLLIESHLHPVFEQLDCEVYTDTKWLGFIIGQIIMNAAKYAAAPQGEERSLVFSAQQRDGGLDSRQVILSIADQGIGIPEEDIPRLFEKGFTGENGRAFAKSTGMGLYLCYKLCEKMGLAMSIESQVGKGTTVHITFPQSKLYFSELPSFQF